MQLEGVWRMIKSEARNFVMNTEASAKIEAIKSLSEKQAERRSIFRLRVSWVRVCQADELPSNSELGALSAKF